MWFTFFIAKNTAIGKTSVSGNIVHANILLCAVIHIEAFAIGGERQTVGLSQVFGQQTNAALCIEAIHALKGNLLLFSLHQIKRGIGEVDCAVGSDNHIIGTVELPAFVLVCQHCVVPIRSYLDNGAQHAGTID